MYCGIIIYSGARRGWSDAEKDFVMKHLGNFVYLGTVPGKDPIVKAMAKDTAGVLAERSWSQIKHFIRNAILSRNRKWVYLDAVTIISKANKHLML